MRVKVRQEQVYTLGTSEGYVHVRVAISTVTIEFLLPYSNDVSGLSLPQIVSSPCKQWVESLVPHVGGGVMTRLFFWKVTSYKHVIRVSNGYNSRLSARLPHPMS